MRNRLDPCPQSLIARRQQAFCFRHTKVEFAPERASGGRSHLLLQRAEFHYLNITCDEAGRRHLAIISCLGEERFNLAYPIASAKDMPLPDGQPVWLRADVEFDVLRFSWSLDGERWTTHEGELDYSLVSDEAGRGYTKSFTGAFVGMACHDISGRAQPADFEFFEYIEHQA